MRKVKSGKLHADLFVAGHNLGDSLAKGGTKQKGIEMNYAEGEGVYINFKNSLVLVPLSNFKYMEFEKAETQQAAKA